MKPRGSLVSSVLESGARNAAEQSAAGARSQESGELQKTRWTKKTASKPSDLAEPV